MESDNLVKVVIVGVTTFIFGLLLGIEITATRWESSSIEAGVAQFHPTTGRHGWKTNLVELERE